MDVLKRAILAAVPAPKQPTQERSSIAVYEDKIGLMLKEGGAPKAIHDALRLRHKDFSGSVGAVKRVVTTRICGPNLASLRVPETSQTGQVQMKYYR